MHYTSDSEKQSRIYKIRNVLCIINVLRQAGYSTRNLPERFKCIGDICDWHIALNCVLTNVPLKTHNMYYMPIIEYFIKNNINNDYPMYYNEKQLIKEMKGLKDEFKNRVV